MKFRFLKECHQNMLRLPNFLGNVSFKALSHQPAAEIILEIVKVNYRLGLKTV